MMKIAMWSGPRNISTAIMRAWDNRPDAVVCDEPFYAYYLLTTGLAHPGAEEVIQHQENNWTRVVEQLTDPNPGGKEIFFQKHMAHHLLPDIDRRWLDRVTNCFLIRDPGEMLMSLVQVIPEPTIEDTGLPQQVEIFEHVRNKTGGTPAVLDAKDVLLDPTRMLTALCDFLSIDFMREMLSWPAGPRNTDGIWAKHWYANVEKSTCFQPYQPKLVDIPHELRLLHKQCMTFYNRLYKHRLC